MPPNDALDLAGITPAYAGKTKTGLLVNGAFKDHPRIRGKD